MKEIPLLPAFTFCRSLPAYPFLGFTLKPNTTLYN